MRVDLTNQLDHGISLLRTWRDRYSANQYPEKVLINVFYRKYTMKFMWNDLNNSFQKNFFGGRKKLWNDFNIGYQKINEIYQQTAIEKTQPVLMELLTNQPDQYVGSISFEDYKSNISKCQQGNNKEIEEIEYSYLYYLLADECIILWSAFGGTGLNKIEAIGSMTGLIIETPEIKSYSQIENIMGRLCVGPYLETNYQPLNNYYS